MVGVWVVCAGELTGVTSVAGDDWELCDSFTTLERRVRVVRWRVMTRRCWRALRGGLERRVVLVV